MSLGTFIRREACQILPVGLVHHGGVPELPVFDAVVVAGGAAKRLGGLDKAELVFRGERLLDRVIAAVQGARQVVAVGPSRTTRHPVTWTREEPEGEGPVAALEAGLSIADALFVVVVAVDLPLLESAFVRTLVAAADEHLAAVAIDDQGNLQPLLACYPSASLRAGIAEGRSAGRSMMAVLDRIAHRTVPDEGGARDCDTLSDLEDLRIDPDGGGHAGRMA